MSIREPYRRRSSAAARDENLPVGGINSTGYGATKLGQHITALVQEESTLMVVMADNGEVFALDPNGLRAQAITSQHPGWICGTYTADVDRNVVLGDLQARAGELRRDAA